MGDILGLIVAVLIALVFIAYILWAKRDEGPWV